MYLGYTVFDFNEHKWFNLISFTDSNPDVMSCDVLSRPSFACQVKSVTVIVIRARFV